MIHPIGGRIFAGGDRRLRPHQQNQALKCPRCDSLNTKFCYYNNYNLSQPRHFCKSCRRYWTKGGVLRNVPVGGGCRKTKRSKPKQSSDERKSNSNSSSESSSLTAGTTGPGTTTEATCTASFNFPESRFFVPPPPPPPPPQPPQSNYEQSSSGAMIDNASDDGGGGLFPEIGSFTNLMTSSSSNDPTTVLNFNVSDNSTNFKLNQEQLRQNQQQWELPKMMMMMMNDEIKMHQEEEITAAGFLQDQMVQADLQNRSSNGFTPLDWQGADHHHGLFDLTGTVDQAYWTQNQWSDHDHSLYLP